MTANVPDRTASLPFTEQDYVALAKGQDELRPLAARLEYQAHDERDDDPFAETIFVYEPYRVPWRDGPRWFIDRTVDGIWITDLETNAVVGATTMWEALVRVTQAIKDETETFIAAIPRFELPKLM